jgi:hypothetical protein
VLASAAARIAVSADSLVPVTGAATLGGDERRHVGQRHLLVGARRRHRGVGDVSDLDRVGRRRSGCRQCRQIADLAGHVSPR